MNGLLPPNSSVSFLPLPAVVLRMMRPTSVEPVKAIFWTSGCSTRTFPVAPSPVRSEEHTSELQSRLHLVCRLLLEKKKNKKKRLSTSTVHTDAASVGGAVSNI